MYALISPFDKLFDHSTFRPILLESLESCTGSYVGFHSSTVGHELTTVKVSAPSAFHNAMFRSYPCSSSLSTWSIGFPGVSVSTDIESFKFTPATAQVDIMVLFDTPL